MSMTASVQSFETAVEFGERGREEKGAGERKGEEASNDHEEAERRTSSETLAAEQSRTTPAAAKKSRRKARARPAQGAASPTDATSALEQADVIAALIDSLQNPEMDAQTATAASRAASVYSFEPLPAYHSVPGASYQPRSRRMSAYSTQSSKSSKTMRSSNSTKSISPPSNDSRTRVVSAKPSQCKCKALEKGLGDGDGDGEQTGASGVPSIDQTSTVGAADGADEAHQQPPRYPPPAKLALILISLYVCIFLVALDRTIIGPAIPEITNKFNSIADIGWYGSAYMLTACGFILFYGQIYKLFDTKLVFLSSILIFEAGSALCGAANSSKLLIIGRAIAGLGSSGLYTGVVLIITQITPLERRPLFMALFGICFGVASVAGPLLGGAFTGSKLTWRWCFFINLPLGAISILTVVFFCHLDEKKERMGWKTTFRQLDPLGTLLFLPSIICLLLALEWAAADYAWSNPRIIALLLVFAVLLVMFAAWQYITRHTTATITSRVLFQRSIAFGCISQFAVGASMLTCALYIPTWFQAIKGVDAMQSGIRTIPLVLSVVVGSLSSGIAVKKIGYYTPFMILGGLLLPAGAGLITTWNVGSTPGMWIGYQVIFGLGVGCTMQHPNLAAQIVLEKKDLPTGTALLSLFQTLGGALFASVGQNTFIDRFIEGLRDIGIPHPEGFVKTGATALKNAIPPGQEGPVLRAYNHALTQGPFLACLIVACLALPAALGMEWRSTKEGEGNQSPPSHPDHTTTTPEHESANGVKAPHASCNADDVRHTNPLEKDQTSMQSRQSPERRSKPAEYSRALMQRLNPDLNLQGDMKSRLHPVDARLLHK